MVAVTQYYGNVGDKKGLTPEQEHAEMANFLAAKAEPWPMVFGGKDNGAAYGVSGIPHWVVLDREGKVAFMHVGYSPEIFKPFREKIQKLVGGKD